MPSPRRRRVVVAAAVLTLAALVAVGRFVDTGAMVDAVRGFLRPLGWWGPVAFVGIYVGATFVGAPGMAFTLLSPLLFGPPVAFVVMTVATSAASVLQFLTARYLARDALLARFGRSPLYAKLKDALHGSEWFVIPAVRLGPFPFTLTNYALGLSPVRLWRFLLYANLVDVPMNAVWVFGAGAVSRATLQGQATWWMFGLTAGAAALVFGVGLLLRRGQSRRTAREAT